jgi:hypothetical protein
MVEQSGYSLTALTVENPSTRYSSLYVPQAGQKFVAVEVIVRNISGETFSSNPLNATLVDTSGFLYGAEAGIGEGDLELLDVNPGEQVRGWVGFVMPQDATPAGLRYQFFGPGVTLQVGLGATTASSASIESFSAPASDGATPTATVTATNTGVPSPSSPPSATPFVSPTISPTPSASPVSLGPAATTIPVAVEQPITPQEDAPQVIADRQAQPAPTLMLLADRYAIPENCVELVENGGFEASGVGWSHAGGQILPVYAAPDAYDGLHSGQAIRLGLMEGVSAAGISAAEQLVQLPKESNKITLRFRYFPAYETPLSAGDFQYVDIYHGETGQLVGRALGVQRDDRAWLEREFDLSALAGEAVRLYFMVSNDGVGGNIALYIDDVSILACRVPKSPDSLAAAVQAQQTPAHATTSPPLVVANAIAVSPEEEFAQGQGFSFGRMGGLLAVLGIAGVALILLPLTKRFSK